MKEHPTTEVIIKKAKVDKKIIPVVNWLNGFLQETTMKDYPSIPKVLNDYLNLDCIAFYKYDGSQIRVEWTKKKGWHQFATRGRLFDKTDKNFGIAVDIFHQTHAETLTKAIKDNYPKAEEAIVFMEFVGPHSFAGLHDSGVLNVENNDPKKLVLFDVNIHKRGIISPKDFISKFNGAEVVYQGKLTEDFIKKVREKQFPIDEGVVCKGGEGHKIWMCKIKTWDYLKKIQKFFGSSYGQYWE